MGRGRLEYGIHETKGGHSVLGGLYQAAPGMWPSSWMETAGGPSAGGCPRTAGHAAGAETFRSVATYCKDIGPGLSDGICLFHRELEAPFGGGIRHHGAAEKYPPSSPLRRWSGIKFRLQLFRGISPRCPRSCGICAPAQTKSPPGMTACRSTCALTTGDGDEIVRAARAFARDCAQGKCSPEALSEADFSGYLYSAGIPTRIW